MPRSHAEATTSAVPRVSTGSGVAVAGLWLYRRYERRVGTGFFFGFCLTGIFVFRFFVEFVKEVQEPWELALRSSTGLDQGQLLSVPFIVLGLYCMCRRKARI